MEGVSDGFWFSAGFAFAKDVEVKVGGMGRCGVGSWVDLGFEDGSCGAGIERRRISLVC